MLNYLLKAKYSFISALVFFIIANPETYKFTQSLFGASHGRRDAHRSYFSHSAILPGNVGADDGSESLMVLTV